MSEKLDVKMGSKEEAFWTDFKKQQEAEIAACERGIEIANVLIAHANKKIQDEQKNNS